MGAFIGRAKPLEPGLDPRADLGLSQAGSGPGPRPGAGSPGLGPRLQGPRLQGPRPVHVGALLAIYVCAYSTLIYVIPFHSEFRKTTNYSR